MQKRHIKPFREYRQEISANLNDQSQPDSFWYGLFRASGCWARSYLKPSFDECFRTKTYNQIVEEVVEGNWLLWLQNWKYQRGEKERKKSRTE